MKNETFTPERIKAEADAFFEWDGEDRSLVTTTSCLLFAQHIAGLMQARAAQPAQAGEAPEAVAWRMWSGKRWQFCYSDLHGKRGWEPLMTVAQHERILAAWQRTQSAGVPEGWRPVPVASLERMLRFIDPAPVRMPNGDTMTFQNPHAAAALREISAEFRAMLSAAPAQGQQVECQECERLRGELEVRTAQRDAAQTSIGDLQVIIEDQEAELSALKAQQVGQEPAGEVHLRTGGGISLLHVELAQPLPPGTKLYTTPQPAPAQDVAGWIPVTERLPEVETDVLVRGVRRNEVMHRVAGLFNGEWSSQETEDLLLGEVTHWMPLPAAPAAHDKQSGEE